MSTYVHRLEIPGRIPDSEFLNSSSRAYDCHRTLLPVPWKPRNRHDLVKCPESADNPRTVSVTGVGTELFRVCATPSSPRPGRHCSKRASALDQPRSAKNYEPFFEGRPCIGSPTAACIPHTRAWTTHTHTHRRGTLMHQNVVVCCIRVSVMCVFVWCAFWGLYLFATNSVYII